MPLWNIIDYTSQLLWIKINVFRPYHVMLNRGGWEKYITLLLIGGVSSTFSFCLEFIYWIWSNLRPIMRRATVWSGWWNLLWFVVALLDLNIVWWRIVGSCRTPQDGGMTRSVYLHTSPSGLCLNGCCRVSLSPNSRSSSGSLGSLH